MEGGVGVGGGGEMGERGDGEGGEGVGYSLNSTRVVSREILDCGTGRCIAVVCVEEGRRVVAHSEETEGNGPDELVDLYWANHLVILLNGIEG